MLRRKHNRFVSRMLAVAIAATSIFATSPMTQAKTVEVTTEVSQVAAEEQIILHAKGTGLTLYAWKGETKLNGEWPGNAMEADSQMGNGWCYAAIPADCTGFIISGGSGKLTDDVTKPAGEYWFVDGKFYDSDPEGPATPTPVPTPGPLNIDNVTPEDGTKLKSGEEQIITVNASSTINDKVVYYKYEVKCGSEYVGDHYYSKNNTYSFKPEDGKEYTVKISIQAHDEANTTVTRELKYTGSKDGVVVTGGPAETIAPVTTAPETTAPETTAPETTAPETTAPETTAPDKTNEPSKTNGPDKTNEPVKTDKPADTDKPNKTTTPDETTAPNKTNEPVKTTTPKDTPKPTFDTGTKNTPKPSTPTPVKTIKPVETSDPDDSGFDPDPYLDLTVTIPSKGIDVGERFDPDPYLDLTVKGSSNKGSKQKVGTSIRLSAKASHGTPTYKYMFFYKKSVNSNNETMIRRYSTSSSCTWKPKKAGTYYVYVRAIDALNRDSEAKIGKFVIKGLSLTVKTDKKSPQKKNKKITITATPKYASGKVKYRFVVKLKNRTIEDTKYKTTSKFNWRPDTKGKYTLYVYAKDSYTPVKMKKDFTIK